ncbi:MAG: hypothetical protein Q7K33_00675 [Candidatus Berkelbacteria bacterium]|nr:hypothetical protein [Candidatus Berkelbacteria bacterium]
MQQAITMRRLGRVLEAESLAKLTEYLPDLFRIDSDLFSAISESLDRAREEGKWFLGECFGRLAPENSETRKLAHADIEKLAPVDDHEFKKALASLTEFFNYTPVQPCQDGLILLAQLNQQAFESHCENCPNCVVAGRYADCYLFWHHLNSLVEEILRSEPDAMREGQPDSERLVRTIFSEPVTGLSKLRLKATET